MKWLLLILLRASSASHLLSKSDDTGTVWEEDSERCGMNEMNNLLQISVEVEFFANAVSKNALRALPHNLSDWPVPSQSLSLLVAPLQAVNERLNETQSSRLVIAEPTMPTPFMTLQHVSNILVACTFVCLLFLWAYVLCRGLPCKATQHSSVKHGCPTSWVVFMGMVYTFTYFTTDQYVPSLPQMGIDLSGSQALMSATVQMNFVVKAVAGIFTAGLSDRIGRRPTLLVCMFLLSLASFCCGCAGRVEWFVAARILQGIGESVEPVIFAMTRDYFPNPEQRFGIVAALQMMSIGGMLVAPVIGGFLAELFNWRMSFFVLALIWGTLAIYSYIAMVESCPDQEHDDYLKDVLRILDPHLLCLLLTESCMMGAYLTFNANVSYFAQVVFHQSTMTTSVIMLTFGALNGLGLIMSKALELGSILRVAKIAVSLYAFTGIISCALGSFFSDFIWAYLVGSFLQASTITMALVSVNALFFEPLSDCAGIAASLEICAKSIIDVIPCLFSVMSTQALIQFQAKGLIQFQAAACMASGLVFSCYVLWPPDWATDPSEKQPHDSPKSGEQNAVKEQSFVDVC